MITFEKGTMIGFTISELKKMDVLKERLAYLNDRLINLNIKSIRTHAVELEVVVKTIGFMHTHILETYNEEEISKIKSIIKDTISENSLAHDIIFG